MFSTCSELLSPEAGISSALLPLVLWCKRTALVPSSSLTMERLTLPSLSSHDKTWATQTANKDLKADVPSSPGPPVASYPILFQTAYHI